MHQLCRAFIPAKRIAAGLIQIGQPLVLKQQKQESLTCFIRFYLTVFHPDRKRIAAQAIQSRDEEEKKTMKFKGTLIVVKDCKKALKFYQDMFGIGISARPNRRSQAF